jgi:DMSO/TMAO reductase YedYZ molybdopterin-dependent catalytic subunit
MKEEMANERNLKLRAISSFIIFFLFLALGVFAWIWIRKQPPSKNTLSGIPAPLRTGLTINENLFSNTFTNRLAKTYSKSEAVKKVRVNGNIGLKSEFDETSWKLQLIKTNDDTVYFSLDDIKKLPKTEIVYDFKCIEGWSQKTWWGGVKFSDFIKHYHFEEETGFNYVGLSTPDKKYYVGIDMPGAMHPQTLLCYEMNGKPLPMDQGYPLRLIIPVKYGIKSIKRIGSIYFSDQRPADYWAERGYDYYSGH